MFVVVIVDSVTYLSYCISRFNFIEIYMNYHYISFKNKSKSYKSCIYKSNHEIMDKNIDFSFHGNICIIYYNIKYNAMIFITEDIYTKQYVVNDILV